MRTFIVRLLFHLSRSQRWVCLKNHTNANIAKVRRGDVINFIVNERFVILRKAPQKLFGKESFCVLRQPQLRVSPNRPHSGKRNLWEINSGAFLIAANGARYFYFIAGLTKRQIKLDAIQKLAPQPATQKLAWILFGWCSTRITYTETELFRVRVEKYHRGEFIPCAKPKSSFVLNEQVINSLSGFTLITIAP